MTPTVVPLLLVMLPALRLWALLAVQVLWREACGRLWWAIAAVVAVALAPRIVPPGGVDGLAPALALAAMELLVGALIGLVIALPSYAVLGAGAAAAAVIRVPPRPVTALLVVAALGTGLALGVHHGVLTTLSASFDVFALGQPTRWLAAADLGDLTRMLHAALVASLALATPVLLAAAVADGIFGLVARGPDAASSTVDPVRAWSRVAAAAMGLGASWAAYDLAWGRAALGLV